MEDGDKKLFKQKYLQSSRLILYNFINSHPHLILFGLIFLVSFLFRAWLSIAYPQIYSWDAYRRIWNREYILILHWLPLSQLLIFSFLKICPSLIGLKLFFSAIAGLTCASGYLLAEKLLNRKTGVIFGLLLAFFPLFVKWSTVPYQEALFFFLVFMGVYFYCSKISASNYYSALFISLACLTRYEAWLLYLVIVIDLFRQKKDTFQNRVSYGVCFSMGLIAWLLIKLVWQFKPVVGGPIDIASFSECVARGIQLMADLPTFIRGVWPILARAAQLIYGIMGMVMVVLSLGGILLLRKERFPFKGGLLIFALGVFALNGVLNCVYGVVSRRLLILPIVLLLFTAAFAVAKIWQLAQDYKPTVKWGFIITLPIVIGFVPRAELWVRSSAYSVKQEHDAAKLLEELPPGSKVLVFPPPINTPWSESPISAIIGNSLKLQINKNIFSSDMLRESDGANINAFIESNNISHVVIYHQDGYQLSFYE